MKRIFGLQMEEAGDDIIKKGRVMYYAWER
jgi:hypothetical protein